MSKNRKMPPGLYGVAMFKFGKGLFFLLAAFGIYGLADQNLPAAFRQALTGLNLDPEKEFWVNLASTLSQITPKNILWVASGAGLYASISWIETIGLLFRQNWAVWLTLVEGAFFIPIELFELSRHWSIWLCVLLGINLLIVVYLFRNRQKFFLQLTGG